MDKESLKEKAAELGFTDYEALLIDRPLIAIDDNVVETMSSLFSLAMMTRKPDLVFAKANESMKRQMVSILYTVTKRELALRK